MGESGTLIEGPLHGQSTAESDRCAEWHADGTGSAQTYISCMIPRGATRTGTSRSSRSRFAHVGRLRGPDPQDSAGPGLFRAFSRQTEEDSDGHRWPWVSPIAWCHLGVTVAMPATGAPFETFLDANITGEGGDASDV